MWNLVLYPLFFHFSAPYTFFCSTSETPGATSGPSGASTPVPSASGPSNSSHFARLSPPPDSPRPPVLRPLKPITPVQGDVPPPLPPRRRNNQLSSGGEQSPVRQHPDAPVLPPRDPNPAPPLPPRRDLSQQTLPRTQSMNIQRQQLPGSSMTLPRRNSERDQAAVTTNGERCGSDTPELPPKTYRVTHSRKQSS